MLDVLALASELEGLASARPVVLDCSSWGRAVRNGVGSAGSLHLGLELLGGLAVEVDLDVEVCHLMVPFCSLNHLETKNPRQFLKIVWDSRLFSDLANHSLEVV